MSGSRAALLQGHIALVTMQVAISTGELDNALQEGHAALRALRGHRLDRPDTAKILASLLEMTGTIHCSAGRVSEAAARFQEGVDALNASKESSISLYTSLLTNLAFVQAMVQGNMRRARETNALSLSLATTHVCLPNIAAAHLIHSQFEHWRGDLALSYAHLRIAKMIADTTCGPTVRAEISTVHARMEALHGRGRDSLRRLRVARRTFAHNSYLIVLSHVIESQILMLGKNYPRALDAALAARSRAQDVHNERALGLANLAIAESSESLGDRIRAVDALAVALPALERSASFFPLAKAFECSARITGNANHRINGDDIMAEFRQ